MVAEQSWVIPKKKGLKKNTVTTVKTAETIGILSFEVANAMFKVISLHKSLSKSDISKLHSDILNCHAIRTMVSCDESYLLHLVLAEKLDELNHVAALVSRLGRWRCTEQALVGFEHVYADLLKGRIEVGRLAFLVKDMERTVKKMEKYVSSTASLYGELGVLNGLEQGVKKQQLTAQHHHDETRRSFEQKIQWQQHDVRHLRDTSLWNQDYDKIVGLMARAVCTIYSKIRFVFREDSTATHIERSLSSHTEHRQIVRSQTFPAHHHNNHRRQISESRSPRKDRLTNIHLRSGMGSPAFACGTSPGRLFMECLSLTSSTTSKDDDDNRENLNPSFAETTSTKSHLSRHSSDLGNGGGGGFLRYGPKSRVTKHAPPSTVGASGLALHYANIVIIIEKFLRYPHLIGDEARDDLYHMLPMSLRISLRKSLESYVKNLAIYDAPLAHEWKDTLASLLVWLAPMAHNMIRWQAERNFEQQQQQQIGLKTNVLLIQTLYFVDREKLEKLICELLVGLNYICRYEHQQNALLSCGSVDFDQCVNWQLNY